MAAQWVDGPQAVQLPLMLRACPNPTDDGSVEQKRPPASTNSAPVPVRRISIDLPSDLPSAWNPTYPEFAAAANSVSLLMPYAEPYFVRSTRDALPQLDGEMAERASAYARQESQHHRQHRRFNDLLVAQHPSLQRAERWMARTYGWLGRTRSLKFNLAFAASSEALAFALARWSVRNNVLFFGGANPAAATLFLWHLAEEVEHKAVAFDVWRVVDGRRLRYCWAMIVTTVILAWFVVWTMAVLLHGDRRLHRPATWVRFARLALSFIFQVVPDMAVSCLPSHHPNDFADPPWLRAWLGTYDAESRTISTWRVAGTFDGTDHTAA